MGDKYTIYNYLKGEQPGLESDQQVGESSEMELEDAPS